jgi:hypothetical protein
VSLLYHFFAYLGTKKQPFQAGTVPSTNFALVFSHFDALGIDAKLVLGVDNLKES